MKVGIIGKGGIATHLKTRLLAEGHEICFMWGTQHDEFLDVTLEREKPRAVFLAISTLDTGEAARDYILACMKAQIPVITSEKGALSYHAHELRPYLDRIGYRAAVGGGTMMLPYLRQRNIRDIAVEIHAVLNGTLNYIFHEMQRGGRSLGEACREAIKLGYAEPGASEPVDLFNGELRDVRMKTCVFFNTVLATSSFISPHSFAELVFSRKELEEINADDHDYRFIVSFSNQSSIPVHQGDKPVFVLAPDPWHIIGALRQSRERSRSLSWLPDGVGNAVHLKEGGLGEGGIYTLSGPGAGHGPTVSAMMADFRELCGA